MYTIGVGTLKIDFRIKFDQQAISKNYVVSGRYPKDQELFYLKCVCVGVAFMVMASTFEPG